MKNILLILLFFWTNLLFSQQNNFQDTLSFKNDPETFIVIEGKKYPITQKAIKKMEINWILSVFTPTEAGLKNGTFLPLSPGRIKALELEQRWA